jgi:hypothetical protein
MKHKDANTGTRQAIWLTEFFNAFLPIRMTAYATIAITAGLSP